MTLIIRGVWVNISMKTISRFLNRLEFELLANMTKIDYHMEEMQKKKAMNIGYEDKMFHFQ